MGMRNHKDWDYDEKGSENNMNTLDIASLFFPLTIIILFAYVLFK